MTQKIYNVALIGYGYWGPVLLRNFTATDRFRVKYVCDHHGEKADTIRTKYPGTEFVVDSNILFEDPTIDVIVIATQAAGHAGLAEQALTHNKHLFIEKPFTLNERQAGHLYHLAKNRDRALWVDHTFLFTPAFMMLQQQLALGKIGKVRQIHSTRTTPGPFHKDANVVWNLAYHDAYLLQELLPQDPLSITAQATSYVHDTVASAATIKLTYKEEVRVELRVDMNHAEKQRRFHVIGTAGSFIWDETSVDKLTYEPPQGTAIALVVPAQEALALELAAFVAYLDHREPALADAAKALQTMRLTTMIDQALMS